MARIEVIAKLEGIEEPIEDSSTPLLPRDYRSIEVVNRSIVLRRWKAPVNLSSSHLPDLDLKTAKSAVMWPLPFGEPVANEAMCAFCHTFSREEIPKCEGCKMVRYCDRHCRLGAHSRHHRACRQVRRTFHLLHRLNRVPPTAKLVEALELAVEHKLKVMCQERSVTAAIDILEDLATLRGLGPDLVSKKHNTSTKIRTYMVMVISEGPVAFLSVYAKCLNSLMPVVEMWGVSRGELDFKKLIAPRLIHLTGSDVYEYYVNYSLALLLGYELRKQHIVYGGKHLVKLDMPKDTEERVIEVAYQVKCARATRDAMDLVEFLAKGPPFPQGSDKCPLIYLRNCTDRCGVSHHGKELDFFVRLYRSFRIADDLPKTIDAALEMMASVEGEEFNLHHQSGDPVGFLSVWAEMRSSCFLCGGGACHGKEFTLRLPKKKTSNATAPIQKKSKRIKSAQAKERRKEKQKQKALADADKESCQVCAEFPKRRPDGCVCCPIDGDSGKECKVCDGEDQPGETDGSRKRSYLAVAKKGIPKEEIEFLAYPIEDPMPDSLSICDKCDEERRTEISFNIPGLDPHLVAQRFAERYCNIHNKVDDASDNDDASEEEVSEEAVPGENDPNNVSEEDVDQDNSVVAVAEEEISNPVEIAPPASPTGIGLTAEQDAPLDLSVPRSAAECPVKCAPKPAPKPKKRESRKHRTESYRMAKERARQDESSSTPLDLRISKDRADSECSEPPKKSSCDEIIEETSEEIEDAHPEKDTLTSTISEDLIPLDLRTFKKSEVSPEESDRVTEVKEEARLEKGEDARNEGTNEKFLDFETVSPLSNSPVSISPPPPIPPNSPSSPCAPCSPASDPAAPKGRKILRARRVLHDQASNINAGLLTDK